MHSQAGHRGLSVFAGPSPLGQSEFVLQNRAVDPGVRVRTEPEAPVSLVTEARIQFCPWCGVRLLDWYKEDLAVLARPDLVVPLG